MNQWIIIPMPVLYFFNKWAADRINRQKDDQNPNYTYPMKSINLNKRVKEYKDSGKNV